MTDDPGLLPGGDGGPALPDGAAATDASSGGGDERMGAPALDAGDASLLGLVDRLGTLLDRSDLSELAVEAGGTRLVLRKAVAIAPVAVAAAPAASSSAAPVAGIGAAVSSRSVIRPTGR